MRAVERSLDALEPLVARLTSDASISAEHAMHIVVMDPAVDVRTASFDYRVDRNPLVRSRCRARTPDGSDQRGAAVKRKRRLSPSKQPSDLQVEKDVATGLAARTAQPRAKRYSAMKLPHERDESTHRPGNPKEVTEQAAKNIEQGKVDTDRYGEAGEAFDRKRHRA